MDYREIKIYLNTNLEGENKDKILFNSSMLIHPEITKRKSSNPYISFNSLYNYSPLSELTLQQRVDFFFNTNTHPLLLNIYPGIITKNVLNDNAQSRETYIKQSNHIIKNNIECMLQLLFLVSPLNSISVTGSLEIVTGKIEIPNLPTFYGFFNSARNVQLAINNEKYSFERLIWMNDFLNNPVYDDLFKRTKDGRGEKYIKFKNWLNDAIARTKNYSTKKNEGNPDDSNVKTSLTDLYESIMMKKSTIVKDDIENVFKCLLLYYILNPTAKSSSNDDGSEFFQNFDKDAAIKIINKKIDERSGLNGKTRTNSANELKQLITKLGFESKNIDYMINEFKSFEEIKKQIEIKKKSKDAVDVAYLNSILDISSFTSFKLDKTTEWLPIINNFFENKNVDLKKANNDTKNLIQSLFGKKVVLIFQQSPDNNEIVDKKITDQFTKDCNDFLGLFTKKFESNKNEEKKNQNIGTVLEDMEKKTYESVKKDVQDIGLNILYRQPGENIDFSIYNDFIFTFVNQELGLKHISSNEFLQNIITMKTDENAEKFFLFLKDTYNHFYLGNGSSYDYANELFTGVNFSRDKNSYEIYVLCDLYKGDDGALYGKQNCINKNETLGKNLDYILSQSSIGLERNRQKWDILYNRVTYLSQNNTNVPPSTGEQKPPPVQQKPPTNQTNPPPVQAKQPDIININIFNQILDEVERKSKKDTIGQEKKPVELNYWQFDKTLSLIENVNLYDRGRLNPNNLLTILSSGDEYEKKLYAVIGEYFKSLNRYSQTVYDKLNLLKSELSAIIENIISRQKSSIPPLTQNEMLELNSRCAKYYLYNKITEKLSVLENEKPKIGGFRKNKKKYRTKRFRLSNKRFTRKNNYSRIY
jgi:hypothetical protein